MVLGFDRDTLLDLSVNVIPLGILLFFVITFTVANPFGWNSLISTLQLSIVGLSFVLLAILTYYAGKAVSRAEEENDREPGLSVPESELETEGDTDEEASA